MRTEYLDGSYLSKNPNWHEEDAPYKLDLINRVISNNSIELGKIADVGCGSGLIAELIAQKYPQSRVNGFEFSHDATVLWSKRLKLENLKLINGSFFDQDEVFDLVTCLDVFEHVEDYYGFLRQLRVRGKHFLFKVPLDMAVLKLLTPALKNAREGVGHIQYFNDYTCIETLKDTGYEIEDAFLSPGFLVDARPKGLLQYIVFLMRTASMAFGHKFAARMFGGYCMVVLAKPAASQKSES
jgi:SAM-dependent methyltransferase